MMEDNLEQLLKETYDPKLDQEIEKLEQENVRLKQAIKEERFAWILANLIIVDCFVFSFSQTWGTPITIAFFQSVFLIMAAQKFGVNAFIRLVDRIFDAVESKK